MSSPSVWETRFQAHGLWSVLDQVHGQLADLSTPAGGDGADSLSRVQWLVELLEAHRGTEDVRGYTPTMLATVQSQLAANVQANLAQYVTDPDTYQTYLRTAADQVDSVLDQMAAWPPLPAKGAAIAAGQAAAAYEKSTKAALDTLTEERDQAIAAVADLKATVAEQTSAIAAALAKFETDSGAALEEKLDEAAQSHVDRVASTVGQIESDRSVAAEQLASLTKMELEGRQVLESLANRAVAKGYRKAALNKAIAGWVWDLVGVVVGGAPLVLLLIHFFKVDGDDASTESLWLARVGISIAAVGLATLCFHRGSVNHAESRRAKRADLRLTTVHPFIANEDDDFKRAIVEGMAERIYLHGKLDEEAADPDPSILEKLIERVQKRRESAEAEAE